MAKYTPKYCAEVAANWLKMKHTVIFFHKERKIYTGRGEWHAKFDWTIYCADARWHNMDAVEFVKLLGGKYDPMMMYLSDALKSLGYRVHDNGGALCVIGDCD